MFLVHVCVCGITEKVLDQFGPNFQDFGVRPIDYILITNNLEEISL